MQKFLWIAILLSPFGYATEPLKILQYLEDPVQILDKEGNFIRNAAATELPVPEVLVLATTGNNELLKITATDGSELWLDSFQVKLNKGKVVELPCVALAQSKPMDIQTGGTMGYGENCN